MSSKKEKIDIGARSIFHVNINCIDLDGTIAFYEMLGFRITVGPVAVGGERGDPVHTALGLNETSKCRGALMRLDTAPSSTIIDFLEWEGHPGGESPYQDIRHVGMARIAIVVDDLDYAVNVLRTNGIEFLSEPVSTPVFGERWVLLRDPNGIFVQLYEFVGGPQVSYYPAFEQAVIRDRDADS